MIYSLPGFLELYWYYFLGAAVLCAVLSYFSERFFGWLKKGIVAFLVLFAIVAGYELITGNSIFSLPVKVKNEFNKDTTNKEAEHRYYKKYEERYGEKPPN